MTRQPAHQIIGATPEKPTKPEKPKLYFPKIELVGDKVLIQVDDLNAQRYYLEDHEGMATVILTPQGAKGLAYITGWVVGVGEGLWTVSNPEQQQWARVPMDCKKGDHVMFPAKYNTPMKYRGRDFVMLNDVNVLFKILKG